MIDLSYKKPEKKNDELPPIFKFWILAIFAMFFAYIFLCGIAGEFLF